MDPVFVHAKKAANLSVFFSKTVFIPLEGEFSEALTQCYRQWLMENLPHWQTVLIAKDGKYFFKQMGPGAISSVTAPLVKWESMSHKLQQC